MAIDVDRSTQVSVVAVRPPPLTGMTFVTEKMVEHLSERVSVVDSTIWRDTGVSGVFWSAKKHLLLVKNIALECIKREGALNKWVYIVYDAGLGGLGSILLAGTARLTGRKLVVHHHSFAYAHRKSAIATVFFWAAGRAAIHIVLCKCMMGNLVRQYQVGSHVFVVNNAAYLEGDPGKVKGEAFKVGFLGNITKAKGIEAYIETVVALQKIGVDVNAVIAGPVGEEAVQRVIDDFVAENPARRSHIGPIYGASKGEFFDDIDILLFPSEYKNEADPLVIYEALSKGVPVLATRQGCIPDILPEKWSFEVGEYIEGAAKLLQSWIIDASISSQSREARATFDSAFLSGQYGLQRLVDHLRGTGSTSDQC